LNGTIKINYSAAIKKAMSKTAISTRENEDWVLASQSYWEFYISLLDSVKLGTEDLRLFLEKRCVEKSLEKVLLFISP